MWISDCTQGRRTHSRLLARVKGLAGVARAVVSTSLALGILLAGVLLPQFWEEATTATGQDERRIQEPIYDLSISEDEGLILLRTRRALLIRDLATGGLIQKFSSRSHTAAHAAWIPNREALLVASHKGPIAEWRGKPGAISRYRIHSAHRHEVLAFAWTRDSRLAATVSSDLICVWDLDQEAIVAKASMDAGRVGSLHFSPDDDLLLAGCDDGSLRLFQTDDLQPAGVYHLASSPVIHARFIQGGQRIFAADRSGRLSLIDTVTGQKLLVRRAHLGQLMAAAVSADDRFAAIAGYHKTIRLYDLESLTETACLTGHEMPATSLQFSQSGDRLYSAGQDGTVRSWDTQTFAELDCYQGTLPNAED